MSITIDLPLDVETALREKASASGKDFQHFVVETLRTEALQPPLDEILALLRKSFAESKAKDRQCEKKKPVNEVRK